MFSEEKAEDGDATDAQVDQSPNVFEVEISKKAFPELFPTIKTTKKVSCSIAPENNEVCRVFCRENRCDMVLTVIAVAKAAMTKVVMPLAIIMTVKAVVLAMERVCPWR